MLHLHHFGRDLFSWHGRGPGNISFMHQVVRRWYQDRAISIQVFTIEDESRTSSGDARHMGAASTTLTTSALARSVTLHQVHEFNMLP